MYEYIPENNQEEFQMKKLTKVMCLVLCLVMLLPTVVACSKKDGSYGAQINMYLADEIYSLDPAYAHLDNSASKVISLIFEGLMTIDEDGDLKKALLDDYDYIVDDMLTPDDPSDDTYTMIIDIRESSWNDGELVSANDFVFAWKRILDPTFDGEAASLLYDIKGAREHKTLMESADNIGLSADKERITITFAHSIDPEEFLRKLASPALVPLRSTTVQSYYHWGSASSTLVTNGPFYVRQFTPGTGYRRSPRPPWDSSRVRRLPYRSSIRRARQRRQESSPANAVCRSGYSCRESGSLRAPPR